LVLLFVWLSPQGCRQQGADGGGVGQYQGWPVVDKETLEGRARAPGRIATVVAVWASWCKPCLEEFATLNALQDLHSGGAVKIIGLCVDELPENGLWVTRAIEAYKPGFDMLRTASGDTDAVVKGLVPGWDGVLPLTIVLDGAGRKFAAVSGRAGAEVLEGHLSPLLAAAGLQ